MNNNTMNNNTMNNNNMNNNTMNNNTMNNNTMNNNNMNNNNMNNNNMNNFFKNFFFKKKISVSFVVFLFVSLTSLYFHIEIFCSKTNFFQRHQTKLIFFEHITTTSQRWVLDDLDDLLFFSNNHFSYFTFLIFFVPVSFLLISFIIGQLKISNPEPDKTSFFFSIFFSFYITFEFLTVIKSNKFFNMLVDNYTLLSRRPDHINLSLLSPRESFSYTTHMSDAVKKFFKMSYPSNPSFKSDITDALEFTNFYYETIENDRTAVDAYIKIWIDKSITEKPDIIEFFRSHYEKVHNDKELPGRIWLRLQRIKAGIPQNSSDYYSFLDKNNEKIRLELDKHAYDAAHEYLRILLDKSIIEKPDIVEFFRSYHEKVHDQYSYKAAHEYLRILLDKSIEKKPDPFEFFRSYHEKIQTSPLDSPSIEINNNTQIPQKLDWVEFFRSYHKTVRDQHAYEGAHEYLRILLDKSIEKKPDPFEFFYSFHEKKQSNYEPYIDDAAQQFFKLYYPPTPQKLNPIKFFRSYYEKVQTMEDVHVYEGAMEYLRILLDKSIEKKPDIVEFFRSYHQKKAEYEASAPKQYLRILLDKSIEKKPDPFEFFYSYYHKSQVNQFFFNNPQLFFKKSEFHAYFSEFFTLSWDNIGFVYINSIFFPIIFLIALNFFSKKGETYSYSFVLLTLNVLCFCIFLVKNVFIFYVFFELITIPIAVLIVKWGSTAESKSLNAGYRFFIYAFLTSLPFLYALVVLYFDGFYDISSISTSNLVPSLSLSTKTQLFIFPLLIIPFLAKMPIFPFHTWLPFAHAEASTVGSVILAAILLKLSFFGMIKFVFPLCFEAVQTYKIYLEILVLLGSYYTAFSALVQVDLKRIIAYSSIAHMSVAFFAYLNFTFTAFQTVVLYSIGHAISASALFLLVGILYKRTGQRNLHLYSDLFTTIPRFSLFFIFFTLVNVAFPFTSGFVIEFLSFFQTIQFDYFFTFIVMLSTFFSTSLCYWTMVRILFFHYKSSSVDSSFFQGLSSSNSKNFNFVSSDSTNPSTKLYDLTYFEQFLLFIFLFLSLFFSLYPEHIFELIQSYYINK